jgi:hypothetical protein
MSGRSANSLTNQIKRNCIWKLWSENTFSSTRLIGSVDWGFRVRYYLNLSQPYGPPWPVTGISLPLPYYFGWIPWDISSSTWSIYMLLHKATISVCYDCSWYKNRYMQRGNLRWGVWRPQHTWRVQWLALELEQDLFFVGAQWTNHRLGERRNETPLAHSLYAFACNLTWIRNQSVTRNSLNADTAECVFSDYVMADGCWQAFRFLFCTCTVMMA